MKSRFFVIALLALALFGAFIFAGVGSPSNDALAARRGFCGPFNYSCVATQTAAAEATLTAAPTETPE